MTVDPERIEVLAALGALGLASAEEERELARLAARRSDVAQTVREYADAAATLALALPPQPPPPFAGIETRLFGAVPIPRRRRSVAAWSVACAGFAAAAAMTFLWYRARRDADDALAELAAQHQSASFTLAATKEQCRRDEQLLRTQVAGYHARLTTLASPSVQLATVRGDAGTLKVYVDPQQRRWLVLAFELPPVPNKDYQLWFVPDGGAPISAGLLAPGPDGILGATPVVPASVGQVRPAVSLEPRGGSPNPTDVRLIGEPI